MTLTERPRRCVRIPGPGRHLTRGDSVGKRTCSIEGCERVHYARSWCHLHYKRWHMHGDPTMTLVDRLSGQEARFWSKVNKDGPIPAHAPELGQCWIWTASCTKDGYGEFRHDGGKLAHRYAYRLLVGAIPPLRVLDHLCRVRCCVNPHHLEPVTRRMNTQRGIVASRKVRMPTTTRDRAVATVYIARTADAAHLYVGVTATGMHRVHSHRDLASWWSESASMEFIHLDNRADALALESFLIGQLDPPWNLSLGMGDLARGRVLATELGLAAVGLDSVVAP
jgi:hypothetical protein